MHFTSSKNKVLLDIFGKYKKCWCLKANFKTYFASFFFFFFHKNRWDIYYRGGSYKNTVYISVYSITQELLPFLPKFFSFNDPLLLAFDIHDIVLPPVKCVSCERADVRVSHAKWLCLDRPVAGLIPTLATCEKALEPPLDKTNKMACAPSEDSDQPGHPPSLIRVFAVRMKKAWVFSYPLSASEDSDQTGRMPRLI